MALLWAGGEDIDFPVSGGLSVSTSSGSFRSGWARYSLTNPSGSAWARSAVFIGGPITSGWLSFRVNTNNASSSFTLNGSQLVNLSNSSTGAWLGIGVSGQQTLVIAKGNARSVLATEPNASLSTNLAAPGIVRIDMQFTGYTSSSTVNVYVNGVLDFSFTGDVTIPGNSNFDTVSIGTGQTNAGFNVSELFVTDTDSRAIMGLNTLAPSALGTTNQWSNNAAANVNPNSVNDANATFVNTTAKDQQYTVNAATPSVYSVTAMAFNVRAAKSSGATPTNVKLGYGSAGSGFFGTGASKTMTTGFLWYEQIDAINPITSAPFTSSDIASLQLDLESA